jgi:hypothetical protein
VIEAAPMRNLFLCHEHRLSSGTRGRPEQVN